MRLIARPLTGVFARTRAIRVIPSASRGQLADELPRAELDGPLRQLHRHGSVGDDEHARTGLTPLDQHEAGGHLELGGEIGHPRHLVVVELGEHRNLPDQLNRAHRPAPSSPISRSTIMGSGSPDVAGMTTGILPP
jgi:hypothetical protein